MSGKAVPPEAERLLAVTPDEFVAQRQQLVRTLCDADRTDEADVVASLRKPTVVVFAVNRAARDRPKAARAAREAALRVKETQVGNQPAEFRRALGELESALDLLAEVAVAHVAPRGKAASDAMRLRVRDLLRSAVADDEAREALVRGVLTKELETVGFSPFAGIVPAPSQRPKRTAGPSRAEQQKAKQRERLRALREELAEAEHRLQEAARAAHHAERERKAAERTVDSLRAKLEAAD